MGIHCNNWDSHSPEALINVETGKHIGWLAPRIELDVLHATPGISDKSIPAFDERDLRRQ